MTRLLSNHITVVGYVTPRQFGPFMMPVPAQNSCLREYAAANDYIYGLPQCEHIFDNCYMQMFSTLNSVPEDGHVVMYSFHMMPKDSKNLGALLEIQKAKRLTLHFVLEKKMLSTADEVMAMIRVLRIADIARNNDGLRKVIKAKFFASKSQEKTA